jgi:hypothetical protein
VPIFVVCHHSHHQHHYDVIDPALALPVKPVRLQHMVIPFMD